MSISQETFFSVTEMKAAFDNLYTKQNTPLQVSINFGGKTLNFEKRLKVMGSYSVRHWAINCGGFWIYDERRIDETQLL